MIHQKRQKQICPCFRLAHYIKYYPSKNLQYFSEFATPLKPLKSFKDRDDNGAVISEYKPDKLDELKGESDELSSKFKISSINKAITRSYSSASERALIMSEYVNSKKTLYPDIKFENVRSEILFRSTV